MSLLALAARTEAVPFGSLSRYNLSAPTAIPFRFVHAKIIHNDFTALLDITSNQAGSGAEPVTLQIKQWSGSIA